MQRGKAALVGLFLLFVCSYASAYAYLWWVAPVIEEALTAPILDPITYLVGWIGFMMYWSAQVTVYTFPLQIGILVVLYVLMCRVYEEKSK